MRILEATASNYYSEKLYLLSLVRNFYLYMCTKTRKYLKNVEIRLIYRPVLLYTSCSERYTFLFILTILAFSNEERHLTPIVVHRCTKTRNLIGTVKTEQSCNMQWLVRHASQRYISIDFHRIKKRVHFTLNTTRFHLNRTYIRKL